MKKILFFIFVAVFLSVSLYAEDKIDGIKDRFPSEWALIGADIAVAGLTVYALFDQISAAGDYELLSGEIDGTTEAGYYRLLYEREKVIGKENIVVVSMAALGAMLFYTAADCFWLHKFFPENVKAKVGAVDGGIKLTINRGF